MNHKLSVPSFVLVMVLLAGCNSNHKASHPDSVRAQDNAPAANNALSTKKDDSIKLTTLIRKMYKWHVTDTMKHDGFKPLKRNPADTLYTSIDLTENQKAIEELKGTGLFASSFLSDYRKIAVRMDKELRNGTSLWREGELPTFNDDVDEWCNCQDSPVDDYWNIIKPVNMKINNNEASFKWTWGDNFYYQVKAQKETSAWKISYLKGFDMNYYNWEWITKNKK